MIKIDCWAKVDWEWTPQKCLLYASVLGDVFRAADVQADGGGDRLWCPRARALRAAQEVNTRVPLLDWTDNMNRRSPIWSRAPEMLMLERDSVNDNPASCDIWAKIKMFQMSFKFLMEIKILVIYYTAHICKE